MEGGFELIDSYSRAQALEDGTLVDVSAPAKEAGFRFPVAMTRAVWVRCVEVPEGLRGLQDESGRLWDILWVLGQTIRAGKRSGSTLLFEVRVLERPRRHSLVPLKSICGPGDNAEPVITIMLPEED